MADSDPGLPLLVSESAFSRQSPVPPFTKPLPTPPCRARYLHLITHPKHLLSRLPWLPQFPKWLRLTGWRPTVLLGLCLAVPALIINIVVLAWGSSKAVDPTTNNSMLYEGSCSQSQTILTWAGIGINIVSALLLACSNATIQCMSAPTRKMVDKMHVKGEWLEIGTSSFSNWGSMGGRGVCLGLVLASTSLPLSLL